MHPNPEMLSRLYTATVIAVLVVAAPAAADQGVGVRLAELDQRIAAAPTDPELRLLRADLRLRDGQPLEALEDLAVVDHRGHPAALLLRALVHERLGSLDLARADLDAHLAAVPATSRALEARGRVQEAAGDLQAARRDYAEALRIHATPELVMARGRVAEALGELDDAAAVYADGAERLGGAVTLRLARVRVLRQSGRSDHALAEVDHLLAASPDHPDWLVLRADVLAESGDAAAADRARRRALERLDELLELRPTAARRAARDDVARALEEAP